MSTFYLRVFLTNLPAYNSGLLRGAWVELPAKQEELLRVFESLGITLPEQVFVSDYDTDLNDAPEILGEHANLEKLNYLAELLDDLDKYDYEKYQAVLESGDFPSKSVDDLINLTFNLDNYILYPDVPDDDDLGRYYIEDSGCYDLSSMGNLANYLDYESFGRDVRYEEGGCFTSYGYVFSDCRSWDEEFDGDPDSIPDRLRVFDLLRDLAEEEDEFEFSFSCLPMEVCVND